MSVNIDDLNEEYLSVSGEKPTNGRYYAMDHAFSSAKVTVEVVRHAVTVRLNSCESQ